MISLFVGLKEKQTKGINENLLHLLVAQYFNELKDAVQCDF